MKQLKDMKLGEVLEKGMLGGFEDLFNGEIKLMKITFTFQDKDATTTDVKLEHKDYYEEDADQEKNDE